MSDDPVGERDALVRVCVDLADRLHDTSPALRHRLHRGLAEVGVRAVEPDHQPFDRTVHDAVDREPTPDPSRDRTVASTALAGYVDHGRVLRRPEVVVYVLEPQESRPDRPAPEVGDDDRGDPRHG